ncbi:hypothetical protein ACFVWR_13325 [Leifsonia sp. NPDC058292]|uniref:hypothetical protein n=1 Tax=Leifsonia sp. NPDC058292 TaxID=3346428 RepID=UPI0036D8E788
MKRTVPIVLLMALLDLTGCTAPLTTGPHTAATHATTTDATPTAPASTTVAEGLLTSCDALYSPELQKFVSPDGSLVLNPAWKSGAGTIWSPDGGYGSHDPTISALLSADPGLVCDWAPATGPSAQFLTTQVRHADQTVRDAALARAKALGAVCTPYRGGDWCVTNVPDGNGALVGESQFFRGGVWLASDWYDAGPDQYTDKMITTLFG